MLCMRKVQKPKEEFLMPNIGSQGLAGNDRKATMRELADL